MLIFVFSLLPSNSSQWCQHAIDCWNFNSKFLNLYFRFGPEPKIPTFVTPSFSPSWPCSAKSSNFCGICSDFEFIWVKTLRLHGGLSMSRCQSFLMKQRNADFSQNANCKDCHHNHFYHNVFFRQLSLLLLRWKLHFKSLFELLTIFWNTH